MFCDLNYRQDEGALKGLEKDIDITFQRIIQRQGCEEKQAICLYAVGRRRRIWITNFFSISGTSLMFPLTINFVYPVNIQ